MSDFHEFKLPPRLKLMLFDAGYAGVVAIKRIDDEPWTEHDESSARALIATHELDAFDAEAARSDRDERGPKARR